VITRIVSMLAAGLLLIAPAYAHHGPASHYLVDQMIAVEGVVTKFRLINPHARIYFDVTTEEGEVQNWLAEGNAAAILKRRGWDKETLSPGDVIKISGNPARDGSHKMDWKLIVFEDGTEYRGGNTVGSERDRVLDDAEKRHQEQSSEQAQ
jgi:Family of unknown function (DUF6152)